MAVINRRRSDKVSFKISAILAFLGTIGTLLTYTWKLSADQTLRKMNIDINKEAIDRIELSIKANTIQIFKLTTSVNTLIERSKIKAVKKKKMRKKRRRL